jgi:hypothetical protein
MQLAHPLVAEAVLAEKASEASGWYLMSSAISARASSARPSWASDMATNLRAVFVVGVNASARRPARMDSS